MLSSLIEMRDAITTNVEVVDEFKVLENCADPLAQVNTEELKSVNERTLSQVELVVTFTVVAFSFVACECFLVCCMGCSAVFKECGCACQRVYMDLPKEVSYALDLFKYG